MTDDDDDDLLCKCAFTCNYNIIQLALTADTLLKFKLCYSPDD
jgi:hypothetical protein